MEGKKYYDMECEKTNEKGGDAPEHGEKPCRGKEEGKIKTDGR